MTRICLYKQNLCCKQLVLETVLYVNSCHRRWYMNIVVVAVVWDRWSSGFLRPSTTARPLPNQYAFTRGRLNVMGQHFPCGYLPHPCQATSRFAPWIPPSNRVGSSDFQRSMDFAPSFLQALPPSRRNRYLRAVTEDRWCHFSGKKRERQRHLAFLFWTTALTLLSKQSPIRVRTMLLNFSDLTGTGVSTWLGRCPQDMNILF